jgi:hypothetical protein
MFCLNPQDVLLSTTARVLSQPLGLLLCPAISGGCDILHVD